MGRSRLVMIGWDAADRGAVETWMRHGDLPTLRALRERGWWSHIAGLPGLGDDGCWASFATGVEPGRHGRFHHRQIVPGTYGVDNFFRDRMTVEPFWSQISDAGRRVAVLDVPKSPLATRLNGLQLANWLPHGEDGPTLVGAPPSLAESLPERFRPRGDFSCHAPRTTDELAGFCARVREHLDLRTALAIEWLRQERWDLFLAVFAESHCIGHHCWNLHDPALPARDRAAARVLGDPVREVHRALDASLARVLAACDADATVLVFSLIGMVPDRMGSWLVDEVLRRLGGKREWSRRIVARLRSTASREPKAAREVAARSAFAVHTDSVASAIRVNLVGREPQGRVEPAAYDDYCRYVQAGFEALVDPDTGRRLVSEVVRVAERYPGPHASAFADLLVVWSAEAPIIAAASAAVGVIRGGPPPGHAGNHRPGGWLVAAGPGVPCGEAARPAAIVDVAPTVGSILGVALTGLEGEPISYQR